MKRYTIILISIVLCFSIHAFSDTKETDWIRYYDCRYANCPIQIDGVADELAWQLAPVIEEVTRFPKDRNEENSPVVTLRTTVKMLWDKENLYVLVTVEDQDIWSTMEVGDKECLCKQETVELFIDPDGDGYDYAEIHANCLNTINDIWIPQPPNSQGWTYRNGEPVDWNSLYAWSMEGMEIAVKNHGTVNNADDIDKGAVYEIVLPWKGFGKILGTATIPPADGDIWRLHVDRYERPDRVKEYFFERAVFHNPRHLDYINFIEDE